MYRRIALAIFAFSISVHCYAQHNPERRGTDKNNAEQYAAYMIQIAHYERGYLGARAQVRDDGVRKIFEVDPGRIYHIKAMQILGRNDLPAEAMSTAPTVGDAYSAARINAWIATLKSQYNRALSWGARCDHATADSTIEVGQDVTLLPFFSRSSHPLGKSRSQTLGTLSQVPTSGNRVQTGGHWAELAPAEVERLSRRTVSPTIADGLVPTRNSGGRRKISARVPAHAARSCHLRSPSGRLPV